MKIDSGLFEYFNRYISNRTDGEVEGGERGGDRPDVSGAIGGNGGVAIDGADKSGAHPEIGQNAGIDDPQSGLRSLLSQIPPDLRSAAEALMAYQAPITDENLEKLSMFMKAFDGMDALSAAALVSGEINAAGDDIALLFDIINGRYNITDDINALADAYSQAAANGAREIIRGLIASKAVLDTVAQFRNEGSAIAGPVKTDAGADGAVYSQAIPINDIPQPSVYSGAASPVPGAATSPVPGAAASPVPNATSPVPSVTSSVPDAVAYPAETLSVLLEELLTESMLAITEAYGDGDGGSGGGSGGNGNADIVTRETAAEAYGTPPQERAESSAGAPGAESTAVTAGSQGYSAELTNVEGVFTAEAARPDNRLTETAFADGDGTRTANRIIQAILRDASGDGDENYINLMKSLYENTRGAFAQAASGLDTAARDGRVNLSGDRIVRDLLFERLNGSPGNIFGDPGSAAYLIKRQYGLALVQLSLLRSSLKQQTVQQPVKTEILKRIGSIEEGIRLIDNMNNRHQYMQIPVNLGDQTANLELYVMKRGGKKKRIDADDATLFLSLGTRNIGRIEALVHIVRRKNVGVSLRAENDAVLAYIKNGRDALREALDKRGYKLVKITFQIIEERTNAANAVERANKLFPNERNVVDYRV